MIYISLIPVAAGFFFLAVAAVGSVRMPDFYTRSHAIAVTDTLGTLLILGGFTIYFGLTLLTAKIILLFIFVYVANPTITHVLVRAALRSGLAPWKKEMAGS